MRPSCSSIPVAGNGCRRWSGATRCCAHRATPIFDMRFLEADDHAFLRERDGQPFLRQGERKVWRYADAQSFSPLRFMPPEVMGYEGRAVVLDPDIFALGDIWDLLSCDMGGKAILARPRLVSWHRAP